MIRCLHALAIFAAGILAQANVYGAERIFISIYGPKQFDEWTLGLIDGKLGFLAEHKGAADDSKLPSIPSDNGIERAALAFVHDGDTLQLDVSPAEQEASKTQAEKHGWYLSAKYDEKVPQVLLTKEKTKYSHWEFIPTGKAGTDVEYVYIRNINDLGKTAWLGMGRTAQRYKHRQEIRDAILSFEKKQEFGIEGGPHSGGK